MGVRCPICLGSTAIVAERTAERERDSDARCEPDADALQCVLDNVRSALNVGSILRTAEGYSFGHLYLCGITPAPDSPQVKKTSLGAERAVKWTSHRNGVELIASLKQDGYCIWALERTTASRAIEMVARENRQMGKRVLVVGNEQAGVDPGILHLADRVVHLEMRGRKQSFNVAVAFAIAAHVLGQTRT